MNFHQAQNKWKHKLIPIENSKNESDKVVDLIIYNNQYALKKKLKVFLVNPNENFICRRCLNSYTSEKMLMIHKPKSENVELTTVTNSSDSHLHWNDQFHKNPL